MKLSQLPQSSLAKQLFTSLSQCGDADTAFYFNNREYPWQTVKTVVTRLDRILSELQLGYQGQVAFVARNRPMHISCFWSLLITDRCASMIHGYQSTAKIIKDIQQAGFTVVLADEQDWNEELTTAARALNCLGIAIGSNNIEVRTQPSDPASTAQPYRDDDTAAAIETLSSGTTGAPKRIQLSRRNLAASTNAAVQSVSQMNSGARTPIISVLPLSNISGVYATTPALAMAMPLAILDKFQLDDWLALVERFQPATADVPPAALASLYQRQLPAEKFRSIKVIRTGAAPLDKKVQAYFQNELGIPVNLSYGASEFCGVITTWTMADLQAYSATKMGSCGRALPGVALRITDPDSGEVLPPDHVGRLEAKVDRVGLEWIATSDQARIDRDGFMWFEGRLEETIFRGGFKLSPLLIAEQIRLHPDLTDAAVIGVDDPRLGQIPVAVVVAKSPDQKPDDTELTDFLRHHLSAPEIPSQFIYVDALPRTASYKISLVKLQQLIERSR